MSHKDFTLPPDLLGLLVMDIPMRIVQRKGQISEVLGCCCCCSTHRASGNETPARSASSVRQNAELYPQWCVSETQKGGGGEGGGVGVRREVLALEFVKCFSDLFKFEARLCREPLKGGLALRV